MSEITNAANRFTEAFAYLMPQLQQRLPVYLTYHNALHTQQVIDISSLLCDAENVRSVDKELVMTAALFHDAGFLHTYADHENASCDLAKEALPKFGYSSEEINKICGIIMATKLPQSPGNLSEKIICDADLHYLGTDMFLSNAEDLFKEFRHQGIVRSRRDWDVKQKKFLSAHHFFTPTAMKMYEPAKRKNLKPLVHGTHETKASRSLLLLDIFLMILGAFIAGFALQGFLVPNKFLDGGITGLSLLIHEMYHINLAYLVIIFNLPLLIAGYFSISKQFAIKTFISLIMLGLCVYFIPYPIMTEDKLLTSIFGGLILGLGIGLTMRAGCALDGVEVLALYTVRRTSFTITEIILAFNIIIFSIATIKFGLNIALYSILTFLAASRMIDYVVEGIQAYTGVTIISGESETIKHRLVNELGRGITIYKGERGFLPGKFEVSSDCDIIFTVVTRMEMRKLKNLVYDTDPKAFVFVNTIREASGGIIKRRHVH